MRDPFLKVKYDKLVFELKFLEADLSYHDKILSKSGPEFEAKCHEMIKERGFEDIFYGENSAAEKSAKKESEKNQQESREKPSKSVEALYRQIAAKTHPDKLLNVDDDIKLEREELFLSATEAKEENNLLKLHLIAADLKIEISDISPEELGMFESTIVEKRNQIDSKKATWMWNWVTSPSDRRDDIISRYVDFMIQSITKTETE